jgi:hypothetical protein
VPKNRNEEIPVDDLASTLRPLASAEKYHVGVTRRTLRECWTLNRQRFYSSYGLNQKISPCRRKKCAWQPFVRQTDGARLGSAFPSRRRRHAGESSGSRLR